MPDNLSALMDAYIEGHIDNTIDELARLCAQPSISAQGKGIQECAELVAAMLRGRGLQVEVIATAGHPIVYAEAAGRSDRTRCRGSRRSGGDRSRTCASPADGSVPSAICAGCGPTRER